MKRFYEDPVLPDECFAQVFECIAGVYIIEPRRLFLLHTINKKCYEKWNDREYLRELFHKASEKSLIEFRGEKHGFFHSNFMHTEMISTAMPIITKIWNEFIVCFDICLVEEGKYISTIPPKMNICQLLSRKMTAAEMQNRISPGDNFLFTFIQSYLKIRHEWTLSWDKFVVVYPKYSSEITVTPSILF